MASRLQKLLAKTKGRQLRLILPLIIVDTKGNAILLREIRSALHRIQHEEGLRAEAFRAARHR